MLRLIRVTSRSSSAKPIGHSLLIKITACLAIALINAAASSAQGFGVLKIKSGLVYKQPPKVHLPNATLAAQVSSQKPFSQKALDNLKWGFERIISSDRRLKVVADKPDTIVTFHILDTEVSSGWETRTKSEYKAIGTRTERNPATDMDETVTDYGWVDVSYNALVFNGKMTVAYEAKDAQTGLIIDSEKLPINYSRDFENGAGAPDDESVRVELGWIAGGTVAARFVQISTWVPVLLPKGKLKRASNLFKEGLWQQAMDVLEAMPSFKSPKDDAYRHYSLAVVYEAMAFMSNDLATTARLLEQSASNYRQATILKPKEDHFWDSRYRAEYTLIQYQKLTEQLRAFEERRKNLSGAQAKKDQPAQPGQQQQAPPATPSHGTVQQISTPAAQPLTNDTIIGWMQSGMAEDYIIASIKHSRGARFDLSASEQARMKQSGVSNRIIKAMRDSQTPKRPGMSARLFLMSALALWPYLLLMF